MAKILIVEDEKNIARFVQLELMHEGYEVSVCHNGREGYEEALANDYDMLLLDIMLPDMSGLEILRRIRQSSDVSIIMLTAKDDTSDKVIGLDLGADDYLTKPFEIEELLARIRRFLKKSTEEIRYKELMINEKRREAKVAEQPLDLTKTEFDLLLYLMKNQELVLTRDLILNEVWGYDFVGDTNIVDVYIRYLRAKIEPLTVQNYIKTVRGVGYRLYG